MTFNTGIGFSRSLALLAALCSSMSADALVAQANNRGTVIGSEFLVNTTTAGAQGNPAVASDAAGNQVYVWESNSGSSWNVYARCYGPTGAPRGGEFLVPLSGGVQTRNPAVAMLPGGSSFLVAWETTPVAGAGGTLPAGHLIRARRFSSGCTALSGDVDISSTPSSSDRHPAVSVNSNGDAVVVWEALGSSNQIRARRISPAGAPLAADIIVENPVQGRPSQPAVAMEASGSFLVAWSSGQDSDIVAQHFDTSGNLVGSRIAVNATLPGVQSSPAIALNPDGSFAIAWQSMNVAATTSEVRLRSYASSGTPSAEVAVQPSASSQWAPALAVDSFGTLSVAWQESSVSGEEIMLKRYDAGLNVLRPAAAVATPIRYRSNVTLACDADGDLSAAWASLNQDGSGLGVYAARFRGYRDVDLQLVKTASNPTPDTGTHLNYSLAVSNLNTASTLGVGNADGVTLTDTLPVSVSYSSFSSSDSLWSCTAVSQTITCARSAALLAASSSTVTLDVIAPSSTGTVTNSATVVTQTAETALGNNSSSADVSPVVNPPPVVSSINLASSSPSNAATLSWTVTFSEAVKNVVSADFVLAQAGGVTAASISSVSGSGTTYTVTASSGTGNGTLGLNLVDDDSILAVDNGAPLAGPGAGNGNFTGQVYAVDKTGPSVTLDQASSQADPTATSPIHFTVAFSESVTGFDASHVSLSGAAAPTAATVTGSGSSYDVAVSGMSTSGAVIATVTAGAVQDAAGNGSTASTSTDNTVTYNAGPSFSFIERTNVPVSSTVTSETVTPSGSAGSLPISISGGSGQYQIGSGNFTNSNGTFVLGSKLTVRHISSASISTSVTSLVTIGSSTVPFRSTTGAVDNQPDAFVFAPQTGLSPGAMAVSEAVRLKGFNTSIPIVPGPGLQYRLDNGAWKTDNGTLVNSPGTNTASQTLQVEHITSGAAGAYTRTTITVGGVSASFTTRNK